LDMHGHAEAVQRHDAARSHDLDWRKWRKFCVYYTVQGGGERHTTPFATRREAERRAESLRTRAGNTDVFVRYTDDA
jgi:hypothetical protein